MSTIPEATLPFKMSLAAFRKSEPHDDLAQLAKEHMKHDLEPSDRDALIKATTRVTTSVTVGTLVGLGLGVYTAIRLRQVRANMFSAFRTKEKPQFVVFANGRQGEKKRKTRPVYLFILRDELTNVKIETISRAGSRSYTSDASD